MYPILCFYHEGALLHDSTIAFMENHDSMNGDNIYKRAVHSVLEVVLCRIDDAARWVNRQFTQGGCG